MKRTALFLCTLILAVAGAQAQSPDQSQLPAWKLYTPHGDKFSVALPNHPSMHTSKEKRQQPEKDRRRRVLSTSTKGVIYTVYAIENAKPGQSLDEFIREQTPTNNAWDLNSARDLSVNGIAGKAFVYPDGRGMVQFFATEDRLYDFRAYGASLDDPKIAQFFSSISFKRKDDSIEVFDGPGSFFEADSAEVYKGKDVDTKIHLQSKPYPDHPSSAADITGSVILRCVFTSKGTVTNIQVIKGLPGGLTERAIEAARQIKFIPATKDGHPVSMWMQLEYNFNLFR